MITCQNHFFYPFLTTTETMKDFIWLEKTGCFIHFTGLIVLPMSIINETPLHCTLCHNSICNKTMMDEMPKNNDGLVEDPKFYAWWIENFCTFTIRVVLHDMSLPWHIMTWHVMAWRDMSWHDMPWYDMSWHAM